MSNIQEIWKILYEKFDNIYIKNNIMNIMALLCKDSKNKHVKKHINNQWEDWEFEIWHDTEKHRILDKIC